MNLVETHEHNPADIVVGDLKVFAEPETIAKGKVYAKWTVLGRVTASGELIACVKTATDGSERPVGVLVADVDTKAAALRAPVYKSGMLDPRLLVMDNSWTAEALRVAFEGSGIMLRAPLAL